MKGDLVLLVAAEEEPTRPSCSRLRGLRVFLAAALCGGVVTYVRCYGRQLPFPL